MPAVTIALLGLYATLVDQIAPDPSAWPRLADYLPSWWGVGEWLALVFGVLLVGALECAFRLVKAKSREVDALQGDGAAGSRVPRSVLFKWRTKCSL